MITLLIASRNVHKVKEIRSILGGNFQYLDLNTFPAAPNVPEDALTFVGNATKKAVGLARWVADQLTLQPLMVLADDSGLEVDALNGAPGVHSARFAALDTTKRGNTPDAENTAKLLRLLENIPREQRTARFRCVLALTPVMTANPVHSSPVCAADEYELLTQTFDGVCEGTIGFFARGKGGFGYDPLFVPHGYDESFAELGEQIKNSLSHRARALEKLKQALL